MKPTFLDRMREAAADLPEPDRTEALRRLAEAAPPRSSTWTPTAVQIEALQAIVAAGGVVRDEGKRGCFAGATRIKRVSFEVFRMRGLLAEGDGNAFVLTAAGRALAKKVHRG